MTREQFEFDVIARFSDLELVYKEQNLIVSYLGSVKQVIIVNTIMLLENRLQNKGYRNGLINSFITVAVELLQNVQNFGLYSSTTDQAAYYVVGEAHGYLEIICGNEIDPEKVGQIKTMLKKLCSYNPAKIREMAVRKLSEFATDTNLSTAGLGYLNILYKPDNKLSYEFLKLPSGNYIFEVKVKREIR